MSLPVQITDPRNGLTIPRVNLMAAMGLNSTSGSNCGVPKLSPNFIRVPSTGGTQSFNVVPTGADCTWQVTAPAGDSWMRIVGLSTGKGPGTVTLQIDAAASAARAAGLIVNDQNTATVLVSQAVAPASIADVRPPVMGGLTATSMTAGVELVWPVAKDSQSGVSSYKVVYTQGATPPRPRCRTGMSVNQQPQLSGGNMKLMVSGLKAGAEYTFRVCALDAAGNVAFGSMWRGAAK